MLVALLLVGAAHIAMGSFTGSSDKNSRNLYSLKSFNKTFYKTASPYSLRAGFSFSGIQSESQPIDGNNISMVSMVKYDKGNTSYIYPYKHTVSVPKFQTPVAPSIR